MKKLVKKIKEEEGENNLPSRIAFVDIETTGGNVFRDRIIEIGVFIYERGKITKRYHSLINPERYLPEEIVELTGITPEQLEGAPNFYSIKDVLFEILDEAVFCAHNVNFDYGFIRAEFKRLGIVFQRPKLCTVKLSRALFPKERKHNLDAVIERMGIECGNRHRALDDAEALVSFYNKLLERFSVKKLEKIINRMIGSTTLPTKLLEININNIPEDPGVYVFYDRSGVPIFIGRGNNIKDKIISHFNDSKSPKKLEINKLTVSIETYITAGDFGSKILVNNLIKKLRPTHNKLFKGDGQIKTVSWPFNSKIIIIEQSLDGKREGHLIDRWCYLGKIEEGNEYEEWNILENNNYEFDFEIYKVLAKYIFNSANQRNIKVLN